MKGVDLRLPTISLDDVETILTHLSKEYHLFSIQLGTQEDSCYVGIVESFANDMLIMKTMDLDATWDDKEDYFSCNINDIRTIEFDNDYLRSLLMLNSSLK